MGFWNEGRQENVNKLAFGVLGLLWRFSSGLAAYQQVSDVKKLHTLLQSPE